MNGIRTPAAFAAIAILLLCTAAPAAAQGFSWEPIGPTGGFRYETIGADSTGVIYAARYRHAGVYRSLDRGSNWELVAPFSMPSFAASRTAVFLVDGGGRLQRSSDRGATWSRVELYSAKGDSAMATIAASPDGALYAMTRAFFPTPAEILRSTDDGASWATLFTPGERGVRIVGFARDGSTFIDADDSSYRSSDRGDTWATMPGLDRAIGDVRHDAAGRLYTAFGRLLHVSTDHGLTWTAGDSILGGGVSHLAVAHDGTIAAAGSGTFVSSVDQGSTWRVASLPTPGSFVPSALVAAGSDFYTSGVSVAGVTEDVGLLRSTDRGASFQSVGRGLPGPAIATVQAVGDSVILAVSSSYVRFRLRRADGVWLQQPNGAREIERGGDGALYAIGNNGYFRSTDAGLTWVLSDTTAGVFPRLGAPAPDGAYVVATGGNALMRTSDFGVTWERLDSEFIETVTAMAFDSSGALIVGTEQAGVFRHDASANRMRALDARVSSSTVTDIVVAPNGDIVIATSGQGVRHSSDGGATFREANGGLGSLVVHALAVSAGGALLAGTDSSIFLSRTDGRFWGPIGAGLPIPVTSISIDPVGRIVVGTSDGVHLGQESVNAAPLVPDRAVALRLACAPNPASSVVRFELTVDDGRTTVRIIDLRGAIVATVLDDRIPQGATSVLWDASATPAGAYRVVVESSGRTQSLPLVVVR